MDTFRAQKNRPKAVEKKPPEPDSRGKKTKDKLSGDGEPASVRFTPSEPRLLPLRRDARKP